jgi:membrane protein implicated in regulation of membrane protease activity
MYNSTFLFLESLSFSEMWFCLIFFFLFLEMGHPGLLYFLSFSCGALCSYVATLYGACVPSQLLLFLAGTCSALLIVHFFVKPKKNQLQTPSHRSNLDALIGKKVTVFVCEQDSNVLQAQISGQIWLVRSIDDEPLVVGQQVIIVDVQGCHLRVDSIK